jgi:hypothetical protein
MTSKDIWDQRILLEEKEREEREQVLKLLSTRYAGLYNDLNKQCSETENGHQWYGDTWYVTYKDRIYRCMYCGASKRGDTPA